MLGRLGPPWPLALTGRYRVRPSRKREGDFFFGIGETPPWSVTPPLTGQSNTLFVFGGGVIARRLLKGIRLMQ